jgi:hypothetical protein
VRPTGPERTPNTGSLTTEQLGGPFEVGRRPGIGPALGIDISRADLLARIDVGAEGGGSVVL